MNSKPYQDFLDKCSNPYFDFINQCLEKQKSFSREELADCQTHHIVPRHHYKNHARPWETFNAIENIVELTFEDHVKAHQLRFEVYREPADKVAYTIMSNLKEDGMKAMQQAGGQAVNVRWKRERRLMYDPEFQREMARRSMARSDAREIRSRGGKVGNSRRHQNVTVRKEDRYLWCWKGDPFLCTFGFDNGSDLCRELQKAKQTKLDRVSGLIKGFRKSLHGWSCRKIENESGSSTRQS